MPASATGHVCAVEGCTIGDCHSCRMITTQDGTIRAQSDTIAAQSETIRLLDAQIKGLEAALAAALAPRVVS